MVLFVTILSSVFFLVGILFMVNHHRFSLQANLKVRAQLLLKSISEESKIDILLEDPIALEIISREYLNLDNNINGLSFYRSDGTKIFGNLNSQVPIEFMGFSSSNLENGFVTTIEVNDEVGKRIGLISLSYSKNTLTKLVSHLAYRLIIMSIIFIVIISFILTWLTRLIYMVSKKEAQVASDLKLAETNSEMQKSFLANMSHELRTPLSAIIGFSKILRKNVQKKQNQINLQHVKEAAETMLVLINDILDFSKIESGIMTLENSDFDINNLLKSVCNSLIPKVPAQVYFDYKSSIKKNNIVYGDYYRVKQILVNVINNAVKYTEEGKITIRHSCSLVEGKILFECTVIDTGIGIGQSSIDDIFTAFKQVHKKDELKNDIVGTGLGLSIVKTLVKRMEGNIICKSEIGKGSTFNFHIKLGVGNINNIESKLIDDIEDIELIKFTSKNHFLVAEDNKLNQLLIENTLKNLGISCDIVANGQEVLDILERNEYDLILMDVQMPILGGVETTSIIRKIQSSFSDIPIIAVTANAIKGDKEYYLESGMNGYVAKPVKENLLVDELKRFVK